MTVEPIHTIEMKHLKHALHNYELCQFLKDNGNYDDWVVTTAFYSALHFVYHKIFPFTITVDKKTIEFRSFEYYYRHCQTEWSRHKITQNLVKDKLPEISSAYDVLLSAAHDARYNNYVVQDLFKKMALQYLEKIKTRCEKKKS